MALVMSVMDAVTVWLILVGLGVRVVGVPAVGIVVVAVMTLLGVIVFFPAVAAESSPVERTEVAGVVKVSVIVRLACLFSIEVALEGLGSLVVGEVYMAVYVDMTVDMVLMFAGVELVVFLVIRVLAVLVSVGVLVCNSVVAVDVLIVALLLTISPVVA